MTRHRFVNVPYGKPKPGHPWNKRALPISKERLERQLRAARLRELHRRLKERDAR